MYCMIKKDKLLFAITTHLKCNAKASVKGHSQIVVELLGKGELE